MISLILAANRTLMSILSRSHRSEQNLNCQKCQAGCNNRLKVNLRDHPLHLYQSSNLQQQYKSLPVPSSRTPNSHSRLMVIPSSTCLSQKEYCLRMPKDRSSSSQSLWKGTLRGNWLSMSMPRWKIARKVWSHFDCKANLTRAWAWPRQFYTKALCRKKTWHWNPTQRYNK